MLHIKVDPLGRRDPVLFERRSLDQGQDHEEESGDHDLQTGEDPVAALEEKVLPEPQLP